MGRGQARDWCVTGMVTCHVVCAWCRGSGFWWARMCPSWVMGRGELLAGWSVRVERLTDEIGCCEQWRRHAINQGSMRTGPWFLDVGDHTDWGEWVSVSSDPADPVSLYLRRIHGYRHRSSRSRFLEAALLLSACSPWSNATRVYVSSVRIWVLWGMITK